MKKDVINKANDLIFSIDRTKQIINMIKYEDMSMGFYADSCRTWNPFDSSRHKGREFVEFKMDCFDGLKQIMLEYFEKELSRLEKELEEL